MKVAGFSLIAALLPVLSLAQTVGVKKITISYPARSGAYWPLFIAKEGGYYQKYGLDVSLAFGVHPAGIAALVSGESAMTAYSLEQAMDAAMRDGSLMLTGSWSNRGMFALMVRKDIGNIKDLKGKRIAVGQIGDAPYNYTVALLAKAGIGSRDVEWIPVGTDVSGRSAALTSGRADATLLTAPAFFKLEESGYKVLDNLVDHQDIFASTVCMFKKSELASNPQLPQILIKAQAEAIKRFYDDKPFAVKAFLANDKLPEADVERIYDLYANAKAFERVPYVLEGAVRSVIAQQSDPQLEAKMKSFDFHKVIDNGPVTALVRDGFFEKLFGPDVKAEEDRKAKLAFGK